MSQTHLAFQQFQQQHNWNGNKPAKLLNSADIMGTEFWSCFQFTIIMWKCQGFSLSAFFIRHFPDFEKNDLFFLPYFRCKRIKKSLYHQQVWDCFLNGNQMRLRKNNYPSTIHFFKISDLPTNMKGYQEAYFEML